MFKFWSCLYMSINKQHLPIPTLLRLFQGIIASNRNSGSLWILEFFNFLCFLFEIIGLQTELLKSSLILFRFRKSMNTEKSSRLSLPRVLFSLGLCALASSATPMFNNVGQWTDTKLLKLGSGQLPPWAFAQYKNIVKNGNFEQWGLIHWQSKTAIERNMEAEKLYNSNWPVANKYVVELDYAGNTKLTQKVKTVKGTYKLKFQYAARQGHPLETSKLIVRWNNNVVASITPTDYKVNEFSTNLETWDIEENDLTFEGAGTSDGYGATIDNVEMYYENKIKGVQSYKLGLGQWNKKFD